MLALCEMLLSIDPLMNLFERSLSAKTPLHLCRIGQSSDWRSRILCAIY